MVSHEALGSALVGGLAAGSIYALIAFGYGLVISTTNIFNFAQGDLVTLGAVLGYGLYVGVGVNPLLVLPLVMLLVAAVGLIEERIAVWPLARSAGPMGWMVTTLAFGLGLRNLMQLYWGTSARSFPWPFHSGGIEVAGVQITAPTMGAIAAGLIVAAALELFYGRTLLGKAMLATAEDREAASVRGLNVGRLGLVAFSGAAAVSGLAGVVIAPSTFVSVQLGVGLGLKSFVAMAIGGFGSHRGALAGGWIFGVVQALTALELSAVYTDFVGLGLLIAILLLFPNGLFGGRQVRTI